MSLSFTSLTTRFQLICAWPEPRKFAVTPTGAWGRMPGLVARPWASAVGALSTPHVSTAVIR
jgi:hypothetical protein